MVAKYGELSLLWWVLYVATLWSLFGFLLSLALWGVEYVNWLASHSEARRHGLLSDQDGRICG